MIPDTHLMKVIHTTKRVGFNSDQPIHKHDLYFTTDGDLVAEECDGGYCDNNGNGVTIEQLEALADEWEARSDRTTGHGTKSSAAYHRCTGDLRDLMEEHR